MTVGYLRFPHIHGQFVTFIADDDVWLGELDGGRATRVTLGELRPRNPRFSPDGNQVAFTASTNGGVDAYVTDLDGGTTRLTWVSASHMLVSGWLDDEHILLSSTHDSRHRIDASMYSLSLDGRLTRLPWGIASAASVHRKGRVVVATSNFVDPSGWKRYRGGMAQRLYVSPTGEGDWKRVLSEQKASLSSPTWVGERLVFTADLGLTHEAQAQVWSVNAAGRDLRQHTSHTFAEGYVRNASSDGQSLVYHARGELYYLASLKAEPQRLDITVALGRPTPVQVAPTDRLERVVPDQGGDASLVEWRGAAYLLTHRGGPARAVADRPGVRVREPRFLDATGRAVWVSDVDGEDCLEIGPLDGDGATRRMASGRLGRVMSMEPNPRGTKVAVGSHDGTVYIVDAARASVKKVGRSTVGEATGFAWSPDGRYLVWRSGIASEGTLGHLVGYDLADEMGFTLTKGRFNDFSPVFTRDGRYLCFLSSRTFDPAYDEMGFDLGFTNTVRPWLAPLSAVEPAPFGPSADGWPLSDPEDRGKGDKDEDHIEFDTDGFEDRLVAFPVPSGRYAHLQATRDGVLWCAKRSLGELGALRAGVEGEVKDTLEHFSFRTRKATVVVEACDSGTVTGDGTRLVVRSADSVWVQEAGQAPSDDDAKTVVDLSRMRRTLDLGAEWRQMFDENARLMRDHYWREDMDGVDWKTVTDAYRPLVERITTHDELIDILTECVAELNTSHAYVVPGCDGNAEPRAGYLGAEFERNANGEVVISRILPGESSDPRARSPLRAAGVAASPGDVIVAIDGHSTAEAPAVGALLLGAAGKVVELTLAHRRQKRRVAVVPTASEASLRYHEWVAGRIDYTREASGGRVGYVHVPDMMAGGWAQFHRHVEEAMRCEAVVVDVRFNSGGHTSELILERLARRAVAWRGARHHDDISTYPAQARRGPVVFLTNAYARSDGDIVTAAAQNLGLGPVVGERSWGGVVGIDGRFTLVDGTKVTQPRYWYSFQDRGFKVENHGVNPDIPVEVGPGEWESDADVQLDVAIAEALTRLGEEPAVMPPDFPPPARFA